MTQLLSQQDGAVASQLEGDMKLLRQAVQQAGPIALKFYNKSPSTNRKADGTEVSEADIAVNAHLKSALHGNRPGYGWLSEEDVDNQDRLSREYVWVVDPIDGTRAFLRGRPEWTISAALVKNGQPVIASVFNPVTQEFFEAIEGKGAQLNQEPIRVTTQSIIEGSNIITSEGILRPKFWTRPWPNFNRLWVNSIAYRIALTASGQADATFSLSTKSDWDLAASHLILVEAGGRISSHTGNELTYNMPKPKHASVVASNRLLNGALLEQLRAYKGR